MTFFPSRDISDRCKDPSAPIQFADHSDVNRYRFLNAIVSELDRAGWPFKTDAGWSDYDVEVPANVWTRLRLTTVSEELEKGRITLHCRVRGRWSLAVKIVLGVASVTPLLLIATYAETTPWVWMSLLSVSVVCWFLDDERNVHEEALVASVEAASKQLSLVPLRRADQET